VEYDRATGSAAHRRVRDLISSDGPVVVSEPVIAEVVAGARDDRRERQLLGLLDRFDRLPFDARLDVDGATQIYRACRRAGVTPRGLLDCMIAAVALRHGAPVLAHDVDLARIASVVPLELDEASLRPP
jgi:predicted nucleic acid-binding protein